MGRVVLAWELGAGFGHLTQLLPIGRRLWELGHHIDVLVQDPAAAHTVAARLFPPEAERLTIDAAPRWRPPSDPKAREVPTVVLADVLKLFGWQQVDRLRAMVGQWDEALARLRPDLIVADFAPTLRLAAEGKVPMLVIGTGYSLPPVWRPLPPMRPWAATVPPFARANEAELLFAANRVRQYRDGRAIDHLADLFGGERSFLLTIPQFDPYAAHRVEVRYHPPHNVDPMQPGPPAAERPGDEIFLYLQRNHPALAPVLEMLAGRPERVQAYISGRPDRPLPELPGNVRLLDGLVDFTEVLPRMRAIIHHAGLGTTYSAAMAGTPQLMFPLNLEHAITAARARETGCGETILANRVPTAEAAAAALATVLSPERGRTAHAAAAAVPRDQGRPDGGTLAAITAAALELMGGG